MRKLIIFDLDNTFYLYEDAHKAAIKKVFENQNKYSEFEKFLLDYENSKKEIQNRLILSPSKHSKLLYFKDLWSNSIDLEEIQKLENTYWNEFIKKAIISKEVLKILNDNKDEEAKYFLFTNQNTYVQLNKITSWNLNFFDLVITSEEVGYEKPHHNFFSYVNRFVKSIYEKGHKIYAVGDDYENDIEFWLKNYNAQSYLIDNSNDEFIKNGEIFNTNILNAINHIFEK
tara:strand:+ start:168 stop:854 length:687 start_codon:yes stop_codon:yes gene_type:complete